MVFTDIVLLEKIVISFWFNRREHCIGIQYTILFIILHYRNLIFFFKDNETKLFRCIILIDDFQTNLLNLSWIVFKEGNLCNHRKYDFNFMIHVDTNLFADVHIFKNFSILKEIFRSTHSLVLLFKHFNLSHQSLCIKIEYIFVVKTIFLNILMRSL